jgi:hypothetical protein
MIDVSFEAIRASGAVPHWFGLGFIQLKLNQKQRMHFWHPDHTQQSLPEEVHNHRYSFSSRVIKGEIAHEIWTYTPGDGDTDCIEVSCKPDQPAPDKTLSTGLITLSGRYTMLAGSSYFFPSTGFHRIIAKHAVTFLCRGEIETENALVLRPAGSHSVCPFAVKKSEAECWEIIRELLR